jgi:hypothetical protein
VLAVRITGYDPNPDVHWKSEGQFQGQGLAKRAPMGLDGVLRNRPTKNSPLSDSRPPVRPPGEPTQTEIMMGNDLR